MGRKKSMTPKKAPREKRTVNKTPGASLLSCHHCPKQQIAIRCTNSDCDLNYCLHCLQKKYSERVLESYYSKWTCPRCNDCCQCKTCLKFSVLKDELASVVAEDLEAKDKINDLMASLSLKNEELLYLTKTSLDLTNSKQVSLDEVAEARTEVAFVKGQLHQLKNERDRLRDERDRLRDERDHLNFKLDKLDGPEVDKSILKSSVLEETCSSQRNQILKLQRELAAANQQVELVRSSLSEIKTEYEVQKILVSDLEYRLREAENLRKELHNTILDLKGKIRIFCRVRRLLPNGGPEEASTITYPTSIKSAGRGIILNKNGQTYPYTFDKVFAQDASQQEVFGEVSDLVQSALDGKKVCIFAYGQTGSGKTYTMLGTSLQKGLIPRSMEKVFKMRQALVKQGWKLSIKASILEIYNGRIRDLLAIGSQQHTQSRWGGAWGLAIESNAVKKPEQYKISHDAEGNTYVYDLTITELCSIGQALTLLGKAAKSRSVARTDMNDESSRSHFVFTLRINGVNEETQKQVRFVLNMIDLAGSERLDKSGATGETLTQTQEINSSVSVLSKVITALSSKWKPDHIPFRESTLTYLLQPSLEGLSKTQMFVMVSPDPSSVSESWNSLQFAARAKKCEVRLVPEDNQVDAHLLQLSSSYPPSVVRTPRQKMPRDVGPTTPLKSLPPVGNTRLGRPPTPATLAPTANRKPVVGGLSGLFTEKQANKQVRDETGG